MTIRKVKVNLEDIAMSIESLNTVPDKYQWKTTTSKLFKVNLLQFLFGMNKMKWIELGAAQGHTTMILSSVAESVVAIDFDNTNCEKIEELKISNVEAKSFDLYDSDFKAYMKENKFDAALIDAVHDEEHVNIDINNCRSAGVDLFVFDDYGGFAGVRLAVDNFISSLENNNIQHRITHVGLFPGGEFKNTSYKVLQNWEGIIVELIKCSV